MPPVRRLTAILAADVAGYSRLMGADEEGTHERLKAHLGELVEPKISQHRGRTVKNTGDGLLAEFVSVVDAVRCAVEIQRGMAEREPEVPQEQRIRFRIGINLGDVIVEEHEFSAMGSMSPRGWKGWRSREAYSFPTRSTIMSGIGCRSRLRISGTNRSRTSRGQCGCTEFGTKLAPPGRHRRPQGSRFRYPTSHPSPFCPSPI
jgi:hypothetical protein